MLFADLIYGKRPKVACPVCGNTSFDHYFIKLNCDHFIIIDSNFYLFFIEALELDRVRAIEDATFFDICTKCETCFS